MLDIVQYAQSAMYNRLKQAAKEANVDLPPGHSARIGNTLWHLLNGTPLDAMKVKGRWKTDESLSKYLRRYSDIMTPYLTPVPGE